MTTITALPTAPQRSDTTNFASRADAWITQFTNTTTGEINTVAGEVNTAAASAAAQVTLAAAQATAAAVSASAAAAQAATAVSAVGATVWASGTYAQYAVTISPTDGLTYRKIGASGTSSTDPKLDAVNWVCLNTSSSAASSIYLFQNFGGF